MKMFVLTGHSNGLTRWHISVRGGGNGTTWCSVMGGGVVVVAVMVVPGLEEPGGRGRGLSEGVPPTC